jgi:hypothetical protein
VLAVAGAIPSIGRTRRPTATDTGTGRPARVRGDEAAMTASGPPSLADVGEPEPVPIIPTEVI